MINLFLYSFLIVLFFTPFGQFLRPNTSNNLYNFSSQLIYGSILLSFFALLINFFTPIDKIVSSLFILISIILLIKFRKIYLSKSYFLYLICSCLIISLLIAESDVYRPDAGLYHLPYIDILNNEKIIFGLSNLHFRYGHISIFQYFSAISNNYLFEINGIVFAQAVIASAIIINFLYLINQYNIKKEYNLHFFFLLFVTIFIFYKMIRYSEFGNDAPSHFIFFYLISEILKSKKIDNEKVCDFLLLSVFIILSKITLLFSAIISLMIIRYDNFKGIFKIKKFYFLVLFFSLWILKNLIVSGCMVYPVKSTCFNKLTWGNPSLTEKISYENEAWTKGWPDYDLKQAKKKEELINIKNYSKKFFWVEYWLKGHFFKILEIILPYISIVLVLFLIFKKLGIEKKNKNNHNKLIIILISILLISIIFWFLKIPVFRYGYSYIISFISLTFSYFLILNHGSFQKIYRIINFLLIVFLITFLSKNILRISKNNDNYYNYPWPKYYSMTEKNNKPNLGKIEIDGFTFYKPEKNGDFCMYFKSPCGHYGIRNLSKVSEIMSYKIIYPN